MTARTNNVMNRLTSTGGAGHTMVEGNVNEFADVKVNNNSVPLVAESRERGQRERGVRVHLLDKNIRFNGSLKIVSQLHHDPVLPPTGVTGAPVVQLFLPVGIQLQP